MVVGVYLNHTVRLASPAVCLAALCILLPAGCSGRPKVAPVSGKITVAGQPATRGSVTFMPDRSKGTSGKAGVGDIGPDGTYALRTFGRGYGAIVGFHRVTISGRAIADDESSPPDSRIPPRYANPRQSGLTAEVNSGSNTIDFDLNSHDGMRVSPAASHYQGAE